MSGPRLGGCHDPDSHPEHANDLRKEEGEARARHGIRRRKRHMDDGLNHARRQDDNRQQIEPRAIGSGRNEDGERASVIAEWEDLVGAPIARVTRPVRIRDQR